jgi:hypothetical protein
MVWTFAFVVVVDIIAVFDDVFDFDKTVLVFAVLFCAVVVQEVLLNALFVAVVALNQIQLIFFFQLHVH